MTRFLNNYLVLMFLMACTGLSGQEVNGPLYGYQQLNAETYKMDGRGNFIYEIDTLSLPFIDDFSSDLVKRFDATNGDAGLIDSVRYTFTVDGELVDSIWFRVQPTYRLSFSLVGDSMVVDSAVQTTQVLAQFLGQDYSSLTGLFGVTQIDTVYPAFPIIEINGDTLVLMADSTFKMGDDSLLVPVDFDSLRLDSTTFYIVPDDQTLWMPSGVQINRSFGVNPPTIGVATFDGVDANGHPYDITTEDTHGQADTLLSKPIDLSTTGTDSVFLSFYYQPEGLGEEPDGVDSLYLQYRLPEIGIWKWAWSAAGEKLKPFQYVQLYVADTFKSESFEFRFINYATLSGSFDHWNIDYVLLDVGRSSNDTVWDDLAIVSSGTTLLRDYQSMPWNHYQADMEGWMADTLGFSITNFSDQDVNAPNIYSVFNASGTEIFTSSPSENNITQFKARSTVSLAHSVGTPPSDFAYPASSNESEDFTVTLQIGHSVKDDVASNHQVSFNQHFSTYYAYDDGVAESTYGLDGSNAKLAIEFNTPVADTLENILIYFPILNDTLVDFTFKITVWQDDLLSTPVYQRVIPHRPFYGNLNQFVGYPVDSLVIVSGTFYVGYEQLSEEIMYVGFDENNNFKSKTAYSVDKDVWYPASFNGVPMIRPNFGGWDKVLSVEPVSNSYQNVQVYPIPAHHYVEVKGWEFGMVGQIFDLQGKVVLDQIMDRQIQVSTLDNGIYLLQLTALNGQQSTAKLVINK